MSIDHTHPLHPAEPSDPGAAAGPPAPGDDDRLTSGQWARVAVVAGLLVLLTATTGIWGLVVVLGILLMIFLHELGHFVAAKRAGMKVTEFFIGFGPRIWSVQRGETEYGLKVIPAGAYVRIIGMHNLEEVAPEDEARSYRQGSFKDRLCVVLAGVAMNFAVATLLIFVLLAVTGVPGGKLDADRDSAEKWSIEQVYPGTGAAAAGIRAGDRITAIDGEKVATMGGLRPLVQPRKGDTVQVTYVRDGVAHTVPVPLRPYKGVDGQSACCLGILQQVDVVRVNPAAAVPLAFVEMGDVTFQSVKGLGRFFSPSGLTSFGQQVANARDDASSAPAARDTAPASPGTSSTTGSGSSAQPEGQDRLLSIVGFFNIGTQAADSGVRSLLMLFVILNIGLGVINLVPLLPFDGGHAAIACYERVQERRKHLQGRYFTDVARLLPLTYAVVFLLVGIFVTTTYLDIANPISVR